MPAALPLPSDSEDQSPTPMSAPVVVPAAPPQNRPSPPAPFVAPPQPVLPPPQLPPPPPVPVPQPSSTPPVTPPQMSPPPPPPLHQSPVPVPPPSSSPPVTRPQISPPSPPLHQSPVPVPPPPVASSPSTRPLSSPSHPPPPRSPTLTTLPHKTPASTPSSSPPTHDISSALSRNLPLTIGITAASVALLMLLIFGLVYWICTLKKKQPASSAHYQKDHHHPPLPPHHAHAGSVGHRSYHGGMKHPSNRLQLSPRPVPLGMDRVPAPTASPGAAGVQPMGFWVPNPPLIPSDKSNGSYSGSFRNGSDSFKNGGFSNHSSFSYDELAAATGGFSSGNVLGQGGFGYVHKGVLPNGKEVAVKCLKTGARQGDREFQAEVEIISRVHHRHLVSLVGYCIEGSQRILVYEFVPNKTLDYHLHGKERPCMDWTTRLRIALGAARGLSYLHEDCHPRIIHRDIKGTNILLDMNFDAKVADFGLAKLTTDNYTHVSTRIMGTFGYLAPEYASSGKLTEKSDVYSYGVMLLELITGRRPFDAANKSMEDGLVDWARPEILQAMKEGNFSGIADPRLEGNYVPQEMARMVACAGACIRHSAKLRPKMSQVVHALEQDSAMEDLSDWRRLMEATGRSASSNDLESLSLDSMRRTPSRLGLNSSGSDHNSNNNNRRESFFSSECGGAATSDCSLDPYRSSSSAHGRVDEVVHGKGAAEK